jgi:tetratricopeptide (TPR) repeat protein
MSKLKSLVVATLACIALIPAASFAQVSGGGSSSSSSDAVAYSRSFSSGVEAFDAGRYEEALDNFLRAVQANPADAEAVFDAGVAYEKLGRPLEASVAFRRALELRPGYDRARARLCPALVAAEQYWDGVEACNRAIRFDRKDPELYLQYGRAFAGAGLYDQAAEAFRLAIKFKPESAEYHLALGLAYDRLGEYRDALDALERAARLAPGLQRARAEYGRVTSELSDLERDLGSVEGYDRLMNVGHAYRLKGWYSKAVAVYTLAARQRPRDAETRYYLGLSYYSMNQYHRALDSYRRALALDPQMAEARRAAEWLSTYVSGDAVSEKTGAGSAAAGRAATPRPGRAEKRLGGAEKGILDASVRPK